MEFPVVGVELVHHLSLPQCRDTRKGWN